MSIIHWYGDQIAIINIIKIIAGGCVWSYRNHVLQGQPLGALRVEDQTQRVYTLAKTR